MSKESRKELTEFFQMVAIAILCSVIVVKCNGQVSGEKLSDRTPVNKEEKIKKANALKARADSIRNLKLQNNRVKAK